jgi:hypothetical protein
MKDIKMTGPNNTLYPTYHCFDDALEFLDYVACSGVGPDNMMLVHSINKSQDGREYCHAWVEDPNLDVAIFAGI